MFTTLAPRKCRAIAEMLTERAILRQALPHDRVLFGAHNLFLKYALGSFVKEATSEFRMRPYRLSSFMVDLLDSQIGCNGVRGKSCSVDQGRTIWMEIVQKLAAVALVAIVNNIEGVMMPVAVTLVMAVTSAMVRPYSQPQVR